jgi:hypothetical protein
MSEARTPEEDTIQTGDETAQDDVYASPDPEDDDTGDGSDEDQAA